MDHSEKRTIYKKITISGVVQGVGFRPFVFRLAQQRGICGSVRNQNGGVEIMALGQGEDMNAFMQELRLKAPPHAKIEGLETNDINPFLSKEFSIVESETRPDGKSGFISPDLAICEDCLREIKNSKDRRSGHFFNTCVNCGPRFTIMNRIPYDRENTSMDHFMICPDCMKEYLSQDCRRFHAETVSCNICGPVLHYKNLKGEYIGKDAFSHAAAALKNGRIIAVKGIGGYHLACSPFDHDAVCELRHLKGRETKPFAMMFKDVENIEKVCHVSENDEKLLCSNPRPITILEIKKDIFAESVLQGDIRCGCFLPYTPLHHLLLEECEMLVMTSANISGSPIIYEDKEVLELLKNSKSPIFSGVLYHDREIVRSAEDSVMQITAGNIQVIRRSRGFVPQPFPIKMRHKKAFLAMGGDLKSSFCLVKDGYAYVSPYFGDLEDHGVFAYFKQSIEDQKALLDIEPEFVVCDSHPGYFSTVHALNTGLPVLKVQHHHAHAASVMAEHGLYDEPYSGQHGEGVIGVCFDGTGYGDDGCIWCGEFFVFRGGIFRRAGHLSYHKILGGDSGATDAKKTAACYLFHAGAGDLLNFDKRIGIIKAALEKDINVVNTSSMGRLFDAAASILKLGNENRYEGECASLLQRCGERALKKKILPVDLEFDISCVNKMYIADPLNIILQLYNSTEPKEALALGFHTGISNMSMEICRRIRKDDNINNVVLSGGVFQNKLLTEMIMKKLEDDGFKVYMNHDSPPNDGGISLGQAYIGAMCSPV